MIRTFAEHQYRNNQELSDKLWNFTPTEGKHIGKQYKLMVPGCLESHPDFARYRGKGVYNTTFEGSGNVRLVFKGVSHTANIKVDGVFVQTHYNAFTPFDFVVKNLAEGTHQLEVEVDNQFSEASSLHIPNDYMTYGGITRGVQMQQVGDVYLKNIFFTPYQQDGHWMATVKLVAENLSAVPITVALSAVLDGKEYTFAPQTIPACETLTVADTFQFDGVSPWMMETPNLYKLQALLRVDGAIKDDLIDQVGFRQITLDGKKILLNGKRIRIKGFNRHEDHPHFGCAIPYSAMVFDMHLIKDLGANSIRTCHYPNDELFLDLCDENGILIWEENHARGLEPEQMENPNFIRQCEDCIREMITAHYNHPSIYIWGVLNECSSDTESGAVHYKRQLEQISAMDASRPTTFASNKHYRDICFEYPTVISNNFYPKWYFEVPVSEMMGKLMDYADTHSGTVKPYIVSEIGAGAIYGCHNRTREKWTEEYQVDALTEQVSSILANDACTGVYVWQFCDVAVSTEWTMKRPRGLNNKGVVDEYRREKLAYYTVKEIFESYDNYFV